jgi:uncharacterized protein YegP (UPF0339 family)
MIAVYPTMVTHTITVFVHDDAGSPSPSVPVYLTASNGTIIATTTTDSSGDCNFTNLPNGDYSVSIWSSGGYYGAVGFVNYTDAVLQVNGFSLTGTSLNFGIMHRIITVFVHDDSGLPCPSIPVYLTASNGTIIATTTTDSSGDCNFTNLPNGDYSVSIWSSGGYYGAVGFVNYTDAVLQVNGLNASLDFGIAQAKTIQFNYVLRGSNGTITLSLNPVLYQTITGEENPYGTLQQVVLRYTANDTAGSPEIALLAQDIESITPVRDDQVSIAISLVQNIPYGGTANWEYPYEVLYNDQGVCSQKSLLLCCLLSDLGYGCAYLSFTAADHAAVGVSCPTQYAYTGSYAFVETTEPTIPTYWQGTYIGPNGTTVYLPAQPDSVIPICNGSSWNCAQEWKDAQTWNQLMQMGSVLSPYYYNIWLSLVKEYGIQT